MSGGMWSFEKQGEKITLPITVEELSVVRDAFLEKAGLMVDLDTQRLFAVMVQHLPPDQDWFDPKVMASTIRKALINEAAYFLMKPEAYEEHKKGKTSEAKQEAAADVVQEAKE